MRERYIEVRDARKRYSARPPPDGLASLGHRLSRLRDRKSASRGAESAAQLMFALIRNSWRLARRKCMPISRAPERGVFKLCGVVEGEPTLHAPLTDRLCAHYRVEIREWDNGAPWPFAVISSEAPFAIRDGQERASVNPAGGTILIRGRDRRASGHSSNQRGELTRLVRSLGRGMIASDGSRRSLEWVEYILLPGDRIEGIGEVRWEADPFGAAGYREVARSLTLASGPTQALFVRARG
jgi:hypothetical protein